MIFIFNKDEYEQLEGVNFAELTKKAKEELNEQSDENIYGDLYDSDDSDVSEEQDDSEKKSFNYDDSLTDKYDTKEIPEINEYDTEIFQGGPSKAQVDIWKKQFEGYGIYVIEVTEKPFIIRTLNRLEYKQIIAIPNIDALLREEIICSKAVLWPRIDFENLASYNAGIPSSIAQVIMDRSGFTSDYAIQVL